MNLIFPTRLSFPLYPVQPTEQDEASGSAFLEALRDFFQHILRQHTSTRRYFQAAEFYFDSSNQESHVRTSSADAAQEAISAVIQNITQPTKGEYVWDPSQNRWVLKLTPA
jgi:predicted HD phosphohydrolase